MKSDQINYLVVGVFVLAVVAGVVTGVAMLTGRTGGRDAYYTSYSDVTGLTYGSQVLYMGFPVGQVEEITPVLEDDGVVFHVELAITDEFKRWHVPSDSIARIKAGGLLAAIAIDIRAGEASQWLEPQDHIEGVERADIFSAVSDTAEIVKDLTQKSLKPLLVKLSGYVDALGPILVEDGGAVIRDLRVVSGELAARAPDIVEQLVSLSDSAAVASEALAMVLHADNARKVDAAIDNVLNASQNIAVASDETRANLDALLGSDSRERLDVMLGNFSRASSNVAALSSDLDRRLGEVLTPKTTEKVQRALDDFSVAARNVTELTSDLHATRRSLDDFLSSLNEVALENRADARRAVEDLRHTVGVLASNIDVITFNLEGTSRNLFEFSRLIRDNPSVLLRGTERRPDDAEALRPAGGGAIE